MNRLPDVEPVIRAYLADSGDRAPDRVLADVAARIAQQPRRARRLRGRLLMKTYARVALAAAAVVVALVGYSVLLGTRAAPAAQSPAPTASAQPEPVIDVPAAVPHRMTPQEAEQIVLRRIQRDEARVGRQLIEPRIRLVRLMPAGSSYTTDGGALIADSVAWLVVFNGTVVSCGSTCDAFTGGATLIDDAGGEDGGSSDWYTGHVGRCVRTGDTCLVVPDPTATP